MFFYRIAVRDRSSEGENKPGTGKTPGKYQIIFFLNVNKQTKLKIIIKKL